ncbi:hypothetical protein SAMN05518672_11372 [Chitinophaga sp. CF118]|uniref:hypothetical protein n=1 Tax=Chitinophaga sp. CF118 TaxID=1884367 RepID=UPI0008F10717|nr:hypothetical protein [Chitinophaga sp. CF118]SFE96730.1 hypothetical protein SAMN05518672_11372 [Chitinophaga sp. CF118]
MSIEFNAVNCQTHSNKKLFGLCDDPPPKKNPAYIDESDGAKWVAVVVNDDQYTTTFTAIDNCIEMKRKNETMDKRCDGVLTYDSNVIFVELKERGAIGNMWVKDAEKQLRTSISYFEDTDESEGYRRKKAYIANSEHPKFKESQTRRMEQFLTDTGYVLRIENRIVLE